MSNVQERCAADKHQPGGHSFHRSCIKPFPTRSADAANAIYTFVTRTLGSAVQVLVLLAMGLVIYLATSKYGNIRLGEGKPEYSTLSWLFMFICAGLGSSTLYWGLLNGPIIIKRLD